MPPPVSASLATILGMGYSGAANLGGSWILLNGSSIQEDDNLIKAGGNFSNLPAEATGEIPVRNRRIANVSLNANLTYSNVNFARNACLTFRQQNLQLFTTNFILYLANGEGYTSDEVYVDSVGMSSTDNALCTFTVSLRCFRWTDLFGAPTPRLQSRFIPFNQMFYQPIPHWMTQVVCNAQPGVPINWQWTLQNNHNYYTLCEGIVGEYPPTPRVVVAGQLASEFQLTTLANPNQRPGELATGTQVMIGGKRTAGVDVPLIVYNLPNMTRTGRQATGFGEQNVAIKWQCSWRSYGSVPS